jgi:hypothetical protein
MIYILICMYIHVYRYYFPNGDFYDGEFFKDKAQGLGAYIYIHIRMYIYLFM